jgi:hypothetical protein
MFEHHYEVLLNRLRNGEDITADVPKAIPAPGKTAHVPPEDEFVQKKLSEIGSFLR